MGETLTSISPPLVSSIFFLFIFSHVLSAENELPETFIFRVNSYSKPSLPPISSYRRLFSVTRRPSATKTKTKRFITANNRNGKPNVQNHRSEKISSHKENSPQSNENTHNNNTITKKKKREIVDAIEPPHAPSETAALPPRATARLLPLLFAVTLISFTLIPPSSLISASVFPRLNPTVNSSNHHKPLCQPLPPPVSVNRLTLPFISLSL